jgi:hypothetical protein
MANCDSDSKDITNDIFGAQFGVGVVTVVYIVFILFIVGIILSVKAHKEAPAAVPINISNMLGEIYKSVKSIAKGKISEKPSYEDNFTGRFTEWFTRMGNAINASSILAILAAGVVIGFNGLIMTPLISTMFPKDMGVPLEIPGKLSNNAATTVNPGQFFIALLGFIISLILFFFIAEFIYLIRRHFKNTLTIFILVVLFLFLTFMLGWNGAQLDTLNKLVEKYPSKCVPNGTKTTAFQLRQPLIQSLEQDQQQEYNDINKETSKPLMAPLPPFGVFG